MNGSLTGQSVLVNGRGSGLGRAVVLAARDAGARGIAAGPDAEALAAAYAGEPSISTETVDFTDDGPIAFGEQGKAGYLATISAANPARRIGTPGDIAQAVMFALTNTFLTGQALHADGGEPLT